MAIDANAFLTMYYVYYDITVSNSYSQITMLVIFVLIACCSRVE